MNSFIYIFLGSLCITASLIIVMSKILQKKITVSKNKTLLAILVATLLITSNYIFVNNSVRIFVSYTISTILLKYLYKEKWSITIIGTFILYLILTISELIFGIIMLSIIKIQQETIAGNLFFVASNIIIGAISYGLILLARKYFKKNISISSKSGLAVIYTSIAAIIVAVAILLFKHFSFGVFSSYAYVDYLLVALFCICGFLILKEKGHTEALINQFDELETYVKTTETVIESYRKTNHENKNQLIAIRSMIESNDNKTIEYLDSILNEKLPKEALIINNLASIPSGGLKGLLYYKASQMKACGISCDINIISTTKQSKDKLSVKDSKDLFKIMGVFLDNAMEAAKESKKKKVSIEGYLSNDEWQFCISNSIDNKVELDKIDNSGYSTKGKSRGFGLVIVSEIINSNNIFEQKREITKGTFTQYLTIKLK